MDVRSFVLKKLIVIGIGQCICVAVMSLIFAMLKLFDVTVIIGGVAGALLAMANFFFMAVAADAAADRAVDQDVKGGRDRIRSSYMTRMIVVFLLLFLLAKSGWANPFALVIPFLVVRPIISVDEFLRKTGENK